MADDFKDTLDTTEDAANDAPAVAPVTAPVITPAAATPVAASTVPATPHANTPGVVVLQWLTYAFWGWLILGLVWLMSVILINAILKQSVSEVVPYAIAASVVLLPIAFVTDLLYRKHEPVKKAGAAMVIMVIHAVIFALFGIGSLITAAFIGLNAAINVGDNIDTQMVGLFTALFAAVLYVAAFARTLNPFKSKKPLVIYSFSMLGVSVLLLILAIAGPVIQSVIARNDKLIEQNLVSVQRNVNDYIASNKALPKSLNDVRFKTQGAEDLVSKNLVEYIPGTTQSTTSRSGTATTTYYYELCVTYAVASNTRSTNSYYDSTDDDGYKTYISTYAHDAGRECYKLKDTTYNYANSSTKNNSSND